MKHCTKCQTLKSAADFPKDRRLKSGLSSQCRACHAIRVRRHYVANKDSLNEKSRQWALNHPERLKQLQREARARKNIKITPEEWAVRKKASKQRLKQYQKEYQRNRRQTDLSYRLKRNEDRRKFRERHIDEQRETERLYALMRRAINKGIDPLEELCNYHSRKAHRERLRKNPALEKCCTKCSVVKPREQFPTRSTSVDGLDSNCKKCKSNGPAAKAWAERNRQKLRAKARERYANETPDQRKLRLARTKRTKARRRSILKNIRRELTAEQWEQIKVIYKHRCAECRQKKFLTQDHIVPLSKGGEHIASNIRPLCGSCNSSKGARPASRQYQPHLIQ